MPINLRVLCPLLLLLGACVPQKKTEPTSAQTANPPVLIKAGFALPEKIEAIPLASNDQQENIQKRTLQKNGLILGSFTSALGEASDYEKDKKSISIYEKGLERFSIIDSILKALKQTRYEDPAVLNKGPYASLILFEDETTKLEKWIVDSKLVVENGKTINSIHLWIESPEEQIFVKIKIFSPATVANKYGEWSINAEIWNDGEKKGQFVAQTKINDQGENIVMINNAFNWNGREDFERGKLVLTQNQGKGKISFSESYNDQGVDVKKLYNSVYSYNNDRVLIENDNKLSCKDRTAFNEINLDYKLYNEEGTDMKKLKKFGFSLKLNEGDNRYFYYGMWNGRHNLYNQIEGEVLPIGTILKSQEQEGESRIFTVAESYPGVLYKKESQTVAFSELTDLDLESSEYEYFSMKYNSLSQSFHQCNGNMGIWDCSSVEDESVNTSDLVNDPTQRKYVYLNSNGHEVTLNTSFENDSIIWVNKSNPVFLSYNGKDFISHSYSFVKNGNYYQPIIGAPLTEAPYAFREGQTDLRVLGQDAAYKLNFSGNLETSILTKRLDKVVKPGMEVPENFIGHDGRTYKWNYATNELQYENGDLVKEYVYSLMPEDDDTVEYAFDYNEKYPLTYLKDSEGQYVYLDQAIYLAPFEFDGKRMNQLRYDGHLGGMENVYDLIRDTDGEIDNYVLDKIVNLPDGDYLDVDKKSTYKLKTIRSVRILKGMDLTECNFELDESISLDDLPEFIAPNIGPIPDIQNITVNEGQFN